MNLAYAIAAVIVFAIEVLIALFVHDGFVRPYVGDALAVVLVYLAVRAISPLKVRQALVLSLAIAAVVELGQLFHVLDALGLRGNRVATVILGGTFDLQDLLAYGLGGMAIAVGEGLRRRLFPESAGPQVP